MAKKQIVPKWNWPGGECCCGKYYCLEAVKLSNGQNVWKHVEDQPPLSLDPHLALDSTRGKIAYVPHKGIIQEVNLATLQPTVAYPFDDGCLNHLEYAANNGNLISATDNYYQPFAGRGDSGMASDETEFENIGALAYVNGYSGGSEKLLLDPFLFSTDQVELSWMEHRQSSANYTNGLSMVQRVEGNTPTIQLFARFNEARRRIQRTIVMRCEPGHFCFYAPMYSSGQYHSINFDFSISDKSDDLEIVYNGPQYCTVIDSGRYDQTTYGAVHPEWNPDAYIEVRPPTSIRYPIIHAKIIYFIVKKPMSVSLEIIQGHSPRSFTDNTYDREFSIAFVKCIKICDDFRVDRWNWNPGITSLGPLWMPLTGQQSLYGILSRLYGNALENMPADLKELNEAPLGRFIWNYQDESKVTEYVPSGSIKWQKSISGGAIRSIEEDSLNVSRIGGGSPFGEGEGGSPFYEGEKSFPIGVYRAYNYHAAIFSRNSAIPFQQEEKWSRADGEHYAQGHISGNFTTITCLSGTSSSYNYLNKKLFYHKSWTDTYEDYDGTIVEYVDHNFIIDENTVFGRNNFYFHPLKLGITGRTHVEQDDMIKIIKTSNAESIRWMRAEQRLLGVTQVYSVPLPSHISSPFSSLTVPKNRTDRASDIMAFNECALDGPLASSKNLRPFRFIPNVHTYERAYKETEHSDEYSTWMTKTIESTDTNSLNFYQDLYPNNTFRVAITPRDHMAMGQTFDGESFAVAQLCNIHYSFYSVNGPLSYQIIFYRVYNVELLPKIAVCVSGKPFSNHIQKFAVIDTTAFSGHVTRVWAYPSKHENSIILVWREGNEQRIVCVEVDAMIEAYFVDENHPVCPIRWEKRHPLTTGYGLDGHQDIGIVTDDQHVYILNGAREIKSGDPMSPYYD